MLGAIFHIPGTENQDWSQLWNYKQFKWSIPETPLSDPIIPWIVCILYLVVVFGLQAWMKNREAYDMQLPTAIHNVILFVWSVFMFVSTVYFGYQRIQARGFYHAWWCETDPKMYSGGLIWITYWFYLSKFWELLDSIIIVLKKKPLIFLHWYHHFAAVLLTWNNLEYEWAQFWVCVMFNSLIHSFMYYYYAAAALKYRIWWKKYLTALQLVQFGIFITAGMVNLIMLYDGSYGCLGAMRAPALNMLWIVTLIILFSKFWRDTYNSKDKEKKKKTQ